MSVVIYYRPIPDNAITLENATSSVLAALEMQFGEMPTVLNRSHVLQLEAMASVYDAEGRSELEDNPFLKLSEYIKEHGAIRVWAEH